MLTTLPNRVSALFADPLQTAFRDFDREFRWPWFSEEWGTLSRKVAPLSMWEDGNALYIDMDVPGVALSDLDVSVENGKLTIRGQRKAPEQGDYMQDERFFGQFERSVTLSEWVDPNTIEASLRDGVLHLKLTKRPEAQRQKISVNYCVGSDTKRIETSK